MGEEKKNGHVVCQLTKKKRKLHECMPAIILRPKLVNLIKQDYPDFVQEGYIGKDEVKKYRRKYMERLLESERGQITDMEQEVIQSLVEHETLAKNPEEMEKEFTIGQRLADEIAAFGGSWVFIIFFAMVIVAWVTLNTVVLIMRPFDPFPFILLNLFLSSLAAFQAPIIMMSQNRKEARDRLRAENDYKVNLKAEIEIRALHEKIDNLMNKQWERLLEIQQLQLDLMEENERTEEVDVVEVEVDDVPEGK